MKTFNSLNKLYGKKGIITFSDPAGAKACLSLGASLNKEDIIIVSDREYHFYEDFDTVTVINFEKNINEYFDLVNPDFVFTGTSWPEKIELSFIKEAKRRGVKTYSFIDHWINIKQRFKKDDTYLYPSEIWLIDEEAREKAVLEGIPAELLRVTGNPYYAYLKEWKPKVSQSILNDKLGLASNQKYMLYVPEPLSTFNLQEKYGFDELSGLKHLEKALDDINEENIIILVKGHPNQNDKIFTNYINQTKSNTIYIKNYSINDLICHSEFVVGYFSNSLIEASIIGKDVVRILIDLKDSSLDPILNKGIGEIITTNGQLNNFIKEL
ncbi:MAG: CDP-glycerol glycerophosphotransferase family protein [Flavobacteriaceae bacterium]